MWIIIYIVASFIGVLFLASNTDAPPISWKQWIVALLIGGPWMLLIGALIWCLENLYPRFVNFNDWWNSLK